MFNEKMTQFADYICKQFGACRADAQLVLAEISPSANWDVHHLDAAVRPYFV